MFGVFNDGITQVFDRQVVFFVGLAHEAAAVVEVDADTGIIVRLVGVIPLADLVDGRIDLDRVDVLRAVQEGVRHVVTGARADDQYVAERVAGSVQVRLGVDLLELARWDDVLVRDAVDVDGVPAWAAGLHRDAVVGRPDVAGRQRFRPEQQHHGDDRDDL